MANVVYVDPMGATIPNPDCEFLRQKILGFSRDYWMAGRGGATLTWSRGSDSDASLLILPHPEHGFYLQYVLRNGRSRVTWLSLADRARLLETVECCDEWQASVGLFVSPKVAWNAIEQFCQDGGRSEAVQWIPSKDMPNESNW